MKCQSQRHLQLHPWWIHVFLGWYFLQRGISGVATIVIIAVISHLHHQFEEFGFVLLVVPLEAGVFGLGVGLGIPACTMMKFPTDGALGLLLLLGWASIWLARSLPLGDGGSWLNRARSWKSCHEFFSQQDIRFGTLNFWDSLLQRPGKDIPVKLNKLLVVLVMQGTHLHLHLSEGNW